METISTEVVDDKSLRDLQGRRIMDAQRREELPARFEASGLTQKAFARREGVNFHTFVSWLALRRREASCGAPDARPPALPSSFVEMSAPAPLATASPRLEIILRDGRIVRGADAASLAALVRLLEG